MDYITTASRVINATGSSHVTSELQTLLDDAAAARVPAVITAGTYLTGPLFISSGTNVILEKGSVIMGTTDESIIPIVQTRVAGIEGDWYPGVLNVCDAHNVSIVGEGTIDGQGPYWWAKYWGPDTQGGMRADYDKRGLRWACDYDCMRPRNVVVMNSHDVDLIGFTSCRSGFWNVHVCYSHDVHLDGIRIVGADVHSPSTDGIDIDSSHNILVENCETNCNDDSICIKSGRDADGIRVGRPCHHITIRKCRINAGFGVTIGSEVSGGVHDIEIRDLVFTGTDCGFRIKSSDARKGYIKNVVVDNLSMTNVRFPFHICLNWNPGYNRCTLPESYIGDIPTLWEKLLDPSYFKHPNTQVSDILVRNVHTVRDPKTCTSSRAFTIEGFPDAPIKRLHLEDVHLDCTEFGSVSCIEDFSLSNVTIGASGNHDERNDNYDNR